MMNRVLAVAVVVLFAVGVVGHVQLNGHAARMGEQQRELANLKKDLEHAKNHAANAEGLARGAAWELTQLKEMIEAAERRAVAKTEKPVKTLRSRTFRKHGERVNCVALSADGKMLASGGGEGNRVTLWDTASDKELVALSGHTGGVSSLSFTRDGKILASGSPDLSVRLWDVPSGKERKVFARAHNDVITSVAISGDGRVLASGSRDKTIKVWDITSAKELHTLTGHTKGVGCLAFTGDGKGLRSWGQGFDDTGKFELKSWDVITGKEKDSAPFHRPNHALHVAFSSDGKTVATATMGVVTLLDMASGKVTGSFKAHDGWITGLAFAGGEKRLASASVDGTAKVWDITALSEWARCVNDGGFSCIASSEDGKLLATGGHRGEVKVWYLED